MLFKWRHSEEEKTQLVLDLTIGSCGFHTCSRSRIDQLMTWIAYTENNEKGANLPRICFSICLPSTEIIHSFMTPNSVCVGKLLPIIKTHRIKCVEEFMRSENERSVWTILEKLWIIWSQTFSFEMSWNLGLNTQLLAHVCNMHISTFAKYVRNACKNAILFQTTINAFFSSYFWVCPCEKSTLWIIYMINVSRWGKKRHCWYCGNGHKKSVGVNIHRATEFKMFKNTFKQTSLYFAIN